MQNFILQKVAQSGLNLDMLYYKKLSDLVKTLAYFTRYLIQKVTKFEPNLTAFY